MSVEGIIIQLREIQRSSGRVFDQQFFASNEAIDNAIQLLSRPKGKEEKLIEDIITVIRQEKYIYEHVHLYRAIKELVERYQEELRGEE